MLCVQLYIVGSADIHPTHNRDDSSGQVRTEYSFCGSALWERTGRA